MAAKKKSSNELQEDRLAIQAKHEKIKSTDLKLKLSTVGEARLTHKDILQRMYIHSLDGKFQEVKSLQLVADTCIAHLPLIKANIDKELDEAKVYMSRARDEVEGLRNELNKAWDENNVKDAEIVTLKASLSRFEQLERKGEV